jgi:transcriptional regulator with XRE-family HTH domain
MDDELIGKRIKHFRLARDLTQTALAQRASISYSLLRKIEAGERDVTQPVAAAVARVLRVDITTLVGQPYNLDGPRRDPIHDFIPGLRTALAFWDLPPDVDTPPRPTAELLADARRVSAMCRLDRNTKVIELLPSLLPEALVAFHESPDGQEHAVLADVLMTLLHAGRTGVYKFGYHDLTDIVGERINWVAAQTQDPLMKTFAAWNVINSLLPKGANGVGLRLMDKARAEIADAARTDNTLLRATGALHLRSSILAARAGMADDAIAYVGEAQQIATRLPEDSDDDWKNLMFGPTNAGIHGVAVAIESQDVPLALTLADRLHLPDQMTAWIPARIGHHHMDLARAYFWQGKNDKALTSLMNARKVAPQQTRNHPTTREVTGLLVRAYRRSNEPLARFAAWVGPGEEW